MFNHEVAILRSPPEVRLQKETVERITGFFDAGATIDAIREETDHSDDWVRGVLRQEGRIPADNPFPRVDDIAHTPDLLEELSEIDDPKAKLKLHVLSETIAKLKEAAQAGKKQRNHVWALSEYLEQRYGMRVSSSYLSLLAGSFGMNIIYYIDEEAREEYKRNSEIELAYTEAVTGAYDDEPNVERASKLAGCSFDMASRILQREGLTHMGNPFEDHRTDVYIEPNDYTKRQEARTTFIRREAGLVYSTILGDRDAETAARETAGYLRRKYGLDIPVDAVARKVRHYNRVHPLQRDINERSREEAISIAWDHERNRLEKSFHTYIQDVLAVVYCYKDEQKGISAAAIEFGLPVPFVESISSLIAYTPEPPVVTTISIDTGAPATKRKQAPKVTKGETQPATQKNKAKRTGEFSASTQALSAEARLKKLITASMEDSPSLTVKDFAHQQLIADTLSTVLRIIGANDEITPKLKGNLQTLISNRLPEERFPGLAGRVFRHAESLNAGDMKDTLRNLARDIS